MADLVSLIPRGLYVWLVSSSQVSFISSPALLVLLQIVVVFLLIFPVFVSILLFLLLILFPSAPSSLYLLFMHFLILFFFDKQRQGSFQLMILLWIDTQLLLKLADFVDRLVEFDGKLMVQILRPLQFHLLCGKFLPQ